MIQIQQLFQTQRTFRFGFPHLRSEGGLFAGGEWKSLPASYNGGEASIYVSFLGRAQAAKGERELILCPKSLFGRDGGSGIIKDML